MTVDPDAEGGPDAAWYRAELDACRKRITELEAELVACIRREIREGRGDSADQ